MYFSDKKDNEHADNASNSNFTPLCNIVSSSNLSLEKKKRKEKETHVNKCQS